MRKSIVFTVLLLVMPALTPFLFNREALALDAAVYWDSLGRYEKYVKGYENEGEFVRDTGFPMYLYSIGFFYLELFKKYGNTDDLERAEDIAGQIVGEANSDFTWNFYASSTVKGGSYSLYNCLFYEYFYELYRITGNVSYLEHSGRSIKGLKNLYKLNSDTIPFNPIYNYNFIPFAAISSYISRSEDHDEELLEMARECWRYSSGGIDPGSGRWFYSESEKVAGFYDSHSALYQMIKYYYFLNNIRHIGKLFPDEALYLYDLHSGFYGAVSDKMLPAGTFYYTPDIPDYTESAGNTLLFYQLYEEMFAEAGAGPYIERALKTILDRQDASGGYLTGPGDTAVRIWYCDNIGWGLSRYLNLNEAPLLERKQVNLPLRIYPNPAVEKFAVIETELLEGIVVNIDIFSLAGELVYNGSVSCLEGKERIVWDLKNNEGRDVAAGVYIIMLHLPDNTRSRLGKLFVVR